MSQSSSIEWTEATWNPLAGCSEISPGCLNCYAANMAHRLEAMGQKKYEGTTKKLPSGKVAWTGKMNLDPDALTIPLKRKKPTTYFVNSMSDLFHEDVPDEFIVKVFAVMLLTQRHTYQVLTKRAERMLRITRAPNFGECVYDMAFQLSHEWMCGGLIDGVPEDDILSNAILGVSVENKQHGLPRISHLQKTPAAVRMLSIEPLLEDLGPIDLAGIGWVIVGGESGPKARPMRTQWVRELRNQCVEQGVPFFFKQRGEFAPVSCVGEACGCFVGDKWQTEIPYNPGGGIYYAGALPELYPDKTPIELMARVGKKKAGCLLDGLEWNEYPEMKAVPS